jgi:hypothetical protein
MSQQLTGIAFIRIDGELVQSKPGAKLKLGGFKREMKTGHKVYGFTEAVEPSELDLTIYHSAATPLEDMRTKTAAVILFETDTGVTYQVSNAVLMETPELSDGDGEVSLKFAGDPAEPQ